MVARQGRKFGLTRFARSSPLVSAKERRPFFVLNLVFRENSEAYARDRHLGLGA